MRRCCESTRRSVASVSSGYTNGEPLEELPASQDAHCQPTAPAAVTPAAMLAATAGRTRRRSARAGAGAAAVANRRGAANADRDLLATCRSSIFGHPASL